MIDVKDFAETADDHGFIVRQNNTYIEMMKMVGPKFRKKPVFVGIERQAEHEYLLHFPTKPFISVISTFAPTQETEVRLCRSKLILKSVYATLRDAGVIDQIVNWKSYIRPNKHNKKLDLEAAKVELRKMQRV